jgi:hypothetical protein
MICLGIQQRSGFGGGGTNFLSEIVEITDSLALVSQIMVVEINGI